MIEQSVRTESELNDFLGNNKYWANGKNFRVDHLHATGAISRWEYENIYGIYLTHPEYAWMAVWMAIVDRNKFRKRNITYFKPSGSGDLIGSISIFLENGKTLPDPIYSDKGAFIYFEDPAKHDALDLIDISNVDKTSKLLELSKYGFVQKTINRRGSIQQNYFLPSGHQALVNIDDWQIALVGVNRLVPCLELQIPKPLLNEIISKRVSQAPQLSSEDYIM